MLLSRPTFPFAPQPPKYADDDENVNLLNHNTNDRCNCSGGGGGCCGGGGGGGGGGGNDDEEEETYHQCGCSMSDTLVSAAALTTGEPEPACSSSCALKNYCDCDAQWQHRRNRRRQQQWLQLSKSKQQQQQQCCPHDSYASKSGSNRKKRRQQQPIQRRSFSFLVEGMTCASCAQRLTAALMAIPGVSAASVSFLSKQASVTLSAPDRRGNNSNNDDDDDDITVLMDGNASAAAAVMDCVALLGYSTALGSEAPFNDYGDGEVYGDSSDGGGGGGGDTHHNHSPQSMSQEGPRRMGDAVAALYPSSHHLPSSSNISDCCDQEQQQELQQGPALSLSTTQQHQQHHHNRDMTTTTPTVVRTSLLIAGMTCGSCAARIERDLLRIAGVHDASVNFPTMSGRVTHDPRAVSAAEIAKAVRSFGYEPTLLRGGGSGGDQKKKHRHDIRALGGGASSAVAGHGAISNSIAIADEDVDLGPLLPLLPSPGPVSARVYNNVCNSNVDGLEVSIPMGPRPNSNSNRVHQSSAPPATCVRRYLIEGMSCASCAGRIERAVAALASVRDCTVSFTTGTAVVTTDGDGNGESVAVVGLIESLGYPVTPLGCSNNINSRRQLRRKMRTSDAAAAAAATTTSSNGVDASDAATTTPGAVGAYSSFDEHDDSDDEDGANGETDNERTRAALERRQEIEKQRAHVVDTAVLCVPLATAMLIMTFTDLMESNRTAALIVDTVQFLCATPIVCVYGRHFFTGAWRSFWHGGGAYTMDTLVAIGTGCSYLYSVVALAASFLTGAHTMTYFDTAGMLTGFMLLGRYLEARAKRDTSGALIGLLSLVPPMATKVTGDGDVRVASSALRVGDQIRVLAGDRVPTDGTIAAGQSDIDAQLVTGESVPRLCGPGDAVVGGTLNVSATLVVRVDRVGEDTMLSQILKIVQDAQSTKPAVQRVADKLAMYFVPFVVVSSLVTLAAWLVLGAMDNAYPAEWRPHGVSPEAFAFNFFIATVVAACPCALGLATPTAIMVGTGVGAQNGLLVKSGVTLEAVRRTDCVVFDKTGTITKGEMEVTSVQTFGCGGDGDDNDNSNVGVEVMSAALVERLVGAVEAQSTHPVAKAVAARLLNSSNGGEAIPTTTPSVDVSLLPCQPRAIVDGNDTATAINTNTVVSSQVEVLSAVTHPGRGVEASVAVTETRATGQSVRQYSLLIGSLLFLIEQQSQQQQQQSSSRVTVSDAVREAVRQRSTLGQTTVVAAVNGVARLVVSLADEPKSEARAVIAHLHAQGIRTLMVTGDSAHVAAAVARAVGISFDDVHAEALPATKAAIVKALQSGGEEGEMESHRASSNNSRRRRRHRVMFVGDGMNDSPALAQADVGVALGAGTEVAIDAADAVLIRSSLVDLLTLRALSVTTVRRIYVNFVWAFAYNLLMLPLASGLLYPLLLFQLPPIVAGGAMVMSSLSVLASSLALRCFAPFRREDFIGSQW